MSDSVLEDDLLRHLENFWSLAGLCFAFWFFMRLLLISCLFEWSIRLLMFLKIIRMKRTDGEKAKESLLNFFYYLIHFYWGYDIVSESEWLHDSRKYLSPHCPLPFSFKLYYASQLGFYSSSLFFLQYNSARMKHKDRNVMFLHHLLTMVLIISSYTQGYWRIGSVVFVIHDITDIFLESTKIMHYFATRTLHILGHIPFSMFVILFFICRLIIFPTRVLWPIYNELNAMAPFPRPWGLIHTIGFLLLLVPLQIMNVWWFAMIIRMILRAFDQGGFTKDYRSDSGEEEEQQEEEQLEGENNNIKNNHKHNDKNDHAKLNYKNHNKID